MSVHRQSGTLEDHVEYLAQQVVDIYTSQWPNTNAEFTVTVFPLIINSAIFEINWR